MTTSEIASRDDDRTRPRVRVAAILIERGKLLLVEQDFTKEFGRKWSLPGGGVKIGETLEQALKREMKEETGLEIAVGRLLFICDRIGKGDHTVHITFAVSRIEGKLASGWIAQDEPVPITRQGMVSFENVRQMRFSKLFCDLLDGGFPNSGTYQGDIANIGL